MSKAESGVDGGRVIIKTAWKAASTALEILFRPMFSIQAQYFRSGESEYKKNIYTIYAFQSIRTFVSAVIYGANLPGGGSLEWRAIGGGFVAGGLVDLAFMWLFSAGIAAQEPDNSK